MFSLRKYFGRLSESGNILKFSKCESYEKFCVHVIRILYRLRYFYYSLFYVYVLLAYYAFWKAQVIERYRFRKIVI